MENRDLSIYIHYPFCLSKCPYCDFNSYKLTAFDEENFLLAYLKELEYYGNFFKNREIKTIFFGGGTPSIMKPKFLQKILEKINNIWAIDNSIEVSMEANPTTFEMEKFKTFKNIGINRLSIGVQSLNDEILKFFGRIHTVFEAKKAVAIAEKIFQDRYSIDLIYARPEQKLSDWLVELEEAVKISPFHISLYQLIIEEGTKFYENKVKTLEENRSAEMYKVTNDFLLSNGIELYEVSNYAKKGYECEHNLNYWNNGEWIGIGAGAHGRLCFKNEFCDGYKIRTELLNLKNPVEWQERVLKNGCGCDYRGDLKKNEFVEELLIMGLRLKSGINIENVEKYLNIDDLRLLLNKNYKNFEKYMSISKDNLAVKIEYFNILDSIIEKVVG